MQVPATNKSPILLTPLIEPMLINKLLKMELKDFANKESFSPEDILEIISLVGKNKDVVLIKNDGVRADKQYTVFIVPSNNPEKSIRCDDNSLQEALKYVLRLYVKNEYIK